MARELPAESNRDDMRQIEGGHALELLREHRLRIPSDERLTRTDPAHPEGHVQASTEGEDAIVQCMDDRGLWQVARVSWRSYVAILEAQREVKW
jgi:hypothetical protein